MEVVGYKLIYFSIFLIVKFNQPQFSGIFLHRLIAGIPNDFITQDAEFFIWLQMLSEELDLSKPQSKKLFPSGEMFAISISV